MPTTEPNSAPQETPAGEAEEAPTPLFSDEQVAAIQEIVKTALASPPAAPAKADSLAESKQLLKTLMAARVDSLGTIEDVATATAAFLSPAPPKAQPPHPPMQAKPKAPKAPEGRTDSSTPKATAPAKQKAWYIMEDQLAKGGQA